MIVAALLGGVAGLGSVATTPQGQAALATGANNMAIGFGWKRRRDPQPGDFWGGCNDARAAGTAPIYRGEPGYRPDMDGDSDGIACEPHRS
jgi:hypothetical protein